MLKIIVHGGLFADKIIRTKRNYKNKITMQVLFLLQSSASDKK